MERLIQIGEVNIRYNLTRSSRKTVGIAVKPDGKVFVSAPRYVSLAQIDEIVKSKAAWIAKKKARIDEIIKNHPKKQYIDGEKFMYMGDTYSLSVCETEDKSTTVRINCGKLCVNLGVNVDKHKRSEAVRDALLQWYVEQARVELTGRVEYYSSKTGLYPRKIYIKEQKTRWGSCTKDNKLNFNWKIIMAPLSVLDYLVVHELSHIRVKNHSKRFWDLVQSILPEYRKDRIWLKQNGIKFDW